MLVWYHGGTLPPERGNAVSFLEIFSNAGSSSRETKLLTQYGELNGDAARREAEGEKIEWVDAQVIFRMKRNEGVYHEEPLIKIAPEAVSVLNAMATLVLVEYNAVTVERPMVEETQYVSVDTGSLSCVSVTVRSHVPEMTDEEIRRRKFRQMQSGAKDV